MFIKVVVFLFFFFLSWTDAFLLAGKVPLFMVLSSILFLYFIFKFGKLNLRIYSSEDTVILFFLMWIVLSGFHNINDKTLNYLLVYVYVLLGLYLFLKGFFFTYFNLEYLLKANYYSVLFILLFLVVEFLSNVIFGIHIQDYIPRERQTTAYFLNSFYRSYGLATEPGVVAYYLSTLGLLAIWYVLNNFKISNIRKIAFMILFIAGEFTIYSATGFAAIIIGASISYFFVLKNTSKFKSKYLLFFFVCLIFIFSSYPEYIKPIFNKIFYLDLTSSGSTRLYRWKEAIDIISEFPFMGIGLGSFSAAGEGSPISWYLFMMAETGITSFILILLFYLFVFQKIIKSKVENKFLLLTCFIAGTIHLAVISTFQYPFIFISIILILIIVQKSKMSYLSEII